MRRHSPAPVGYLQARWKAQSRSVHSLTDTVASKRTVKLACPEYVNRADRNTFGGANAAEERACFVEFVNRQSKPMQIAST
mmetsp:Transcript_5641/g.12269  ORF Transcript_5641/g.12269 Transcript_5641/m.12269 type:complete len:81 (+) Transcript_5641:313-555(+)|eukprot:6104110-Pleurochrysis_carterae.AAC.5